MKTERFALWHSEVILDLDGVTPYLTRRRIFMTPLVSLYLHTIHKEDGDRSLHDHPAIFLSLILRGGYLEEYAKLPRKGQPFTDHRIAAARMPGHLNYIGRRRAHRISIVVPGCRTLVLLGPRRSGDNAWGFWKQGATQRTPWKAYMIEQGYTHVEDDE